MTELTDKGGALKEKRVGADRLGRYEAAGLEARIYEMWLQGGYFKGGRDRSRKPYAIVMPPPNVTGVLHLGHALDNAMQDLLIRWKRMQGFDVLWMPGMDHAGIATQTRVEADLKEREGKTRHALGRERFVERVWQWKEEYAEVIRGQLFRLGVSCDFSRERFTMDPGLSRAVREVFVSLYERGLIYRGAYIIHWCPRCETALSDIEVEHEDVRSKLYHVTYPIVDGDGFLTVATTRPETMFGDVAVAVHPEDERYRHLIGRSLRLPLTDRTIPVVADEYVDRAFGTGAVKITPAHDPNDFEVGLRHSLPSVNIMNKDGTLNESAGRFAGLDRLAARTAVVKELEASGALTSEDHTHAVGHCSRCKTVVEPWLSTQWFVKMKPLAGPAKEIVERGEIRFVPERFARPYEYWLDNIRDWCISRQLWWGHRIPAWYCDTCGEIVVAREDPSACPACGSAELRQDEDVLDTWFSSALWPFSTMGWPDDQDGDFARYFPTDVLVTGADIITFWVSRMIFSSLAFTGRRPFGEVLIHGLVRDAQNRKFSKSLGNGIDPMDVIDRYSADALRFMLTTAAAPGQDMKFHFEKVEAAQALVTKVWNAARFVLAHAQEVRASAPVPSQDRSLADRYILHRLAGTVDVYTAQLSSYDFAEAGRTIYEFIWNDFCDWYIELAKVALQGQDSAGADRSAPERRSAAQTLVFVLDQSLRLLHPYMPFVTEAIWQMLPHDGETIMLAPWPEPREDWRDCEAEGRMALIMDVIRAVRNMRHETGVPPAQRVPLLAKAAPAVEPALAGARPYIERLCNLSSLMVDAAVAPPGERLTAVLSGVELYIPLAGLVDREAERVRLQKELDDLAFEVDRIVNKLANPQFVERAPAALVEGERKKLAGYEERRTKVRQELLRLGS